MAPLLEMIEISKLFGDTLANDRANFEVEPGEIHALLGENGAGKSTLMSILYGLYRPTSGEIRLRGKPVEITAPRVAIANGIGMVHQHFMLIPALSVVENVVLGLRQDREPLLDLRKAASRILDVSKQYGMAVDPQARVSELSVGEQQRVEIVKALYRGADLLILDEPTAVLTPQEAQDLFRVLRTLKDEGHAVIFISHKLNEVMAISDRVTVLRSGQTVGTVKTAATRQEELARMMVGREVLFDLKRPPVEPGPVVLEVRDLEAGGLRGGLRALDRISFEVRAGEILGIAGVDGNGQSELVEAVTGLRKVSGGQVLIRSKDVTNSTPRRVLECDVAHVPGDRQRRGLVPSMSVKENLILQVYYRRPYARGAFINWRVVHDYCRRLVADYDVRTAGIEALVRHLSGGNQQKIILARELDRRPNLLIAMHPTRGLDVGATEFVHSQIFRERERGCAVLLVSTELDEIMALSDRIAVIYEGRVIGIVRRDEAELQQLGLMMAGVKGGTGA